MKKPTLLWETHQVYKAFALISLIGLHTLIWWISTGDDGIIQSLSPDESVLLYFYFYFFGWFSLTFGLTTGISFRFWLERSKPSQDSFLITPPTWRSVILRCLFLTLFGFWLNYQSWYLFQFLALSIFVTYLILRISKFNFNFLWIFGIAIALLSEPLRMHFSSTPTTLLSAIFIGDSQGLYFWPFFPWYSLFVLGIFLGHLKLSPFGKTSKNISNLCLLVGLALTNFAALTDHLVINLDLSNFWGPQLFHPSLITFLGWTGMMLTSLGFLDFLLRTRLKFLFQILKPFNRHSLILYLIHYKVCVYYIYISRSQDILKLIKATAIQIAFLYLVALVLDQLLKFAIRLKARNNERLVAECL